MFIQRHHRLIFYSLWLLLGLIQSHLTELQDDEAYYWVYAQYPDWGYFDHPPMIALLVKFGSAILPGEIGVRLLPLLLNVLSIFIIEKLLLNKNIFLFYAITLSIAVVQLTGFIAVPDIPLIFFTALFFLCYKNFIGRINVLNAIFLGLAVALLFYSKYHALLIVLFTLLSNLRLLRRIETWLAFLVALLLFIPHLWWQNEHHWVSLKYHLFENHVNTYKIRYTLDYLIGQLLLAGPLAGVILIPAALLFKANDEFTKALKFTLVGFYVFFLISSFRGNVEPNWTAPIMIPLIVLAHQYLSNHIIWKKWLYRILPATLLLVLFARIAMIIDILPFEIVQRRYHSWKEWPAELKQRTQGQKIVFSNSYQRASKYWFYTGQMTYSLNHAHERRNNFNFWPVEDSVIGKPVYYFDIFDHWRFPDSIQTPFGWLGYKFDSSYYSFAKVTIVPSKFIYHIKQQDSVSLTFNSLIPEHYKKYIARVKTNLRICVYSPYRWVKDIPTNLTLQDLAKGPQTIHIHPRLEPGKYFLRFSLQAGDYNPTHNSQKILLRIS